MEFRCERDALADVLGTATRAVATRGGSLAVLSGAKVELSGDRLVVTGSDLDLTISASSQVGGQEDGVFVAPARLLNDIVRALEPGAVTVSADAEEARISSGRSSFTVRLLAADDFPRLPEPAGEQVTLAAGAPGRSTVS